MTTEDARIEYAHLPNQFCIIPAVGILPRNGRAKTYQFRIAFLFGPYAVSIGCFKRRNHIDLL